MKRWWNRWSIVLLILLLPFAGTASNSVVLLDQSLKVSLAEADLTYVGEDDGDWAGYFASPAGDVNGDGLGDMLIGAPMAGEKVCPYPLDPNGECPPPFIPKGQGVSYLILGRPKGDWLSNPVNLLNADASFLGCEVNSMTGRQLYTAGDVNGDGYDDFLISGWKCDEIHQNYTGKAYLFLGRPDVGSWGRYFDVEKADASFFGEDQKDFLSYYVSSAGDVNADGYDDFLITSTHFEYDNPCAPGTAEDCNDCCKNFLESAELFDPLTRSWSTTGSMNTPRLGHAATLLQDGDLVLVSGGQNLDSYLNSTELFDPGAGTWTTLGSMDQARSRHTATKLAGGRVLVAGGENSSGALDSAELFNLATKDWVSTGSMATARSSHTANLLDDGSVLVAGGHTESASLKSAEIYSPDDGTWTATGNMGTARYGHTAVKLSDGKVLVVGGQNNSGFLNSAELYDPNTGTWAATGAMNTARAGHTATLLSDGKVIVVGGQNASGYIISAEIFDPLTETWSETNELLYEEHTDHTADLLSDGSVLVTGGENVSGSRNTFQIYEPVSGTWTRVISQTLDIPRAGHISAGLKDGKVLVAGGKYCTDFGKTYLFLGRQDASTWGKNFPVQNADASFIGEAADDRLGRSASGVGDVNGDGYGDFMIGAISSDYGGIDAGQNYLFLGRAAPGDPGYDPNRPWWGPDYTVAMADASFVGEEADDQSGRRVADAGDVNGDGLDDMIIGAATNDYTAPDAGIAHLILGRAAADWGMRYDLANADASFVGEEARDQAGRRLSGAGDVNNDGYDDFLIGAPHNEETGILAGKAYLLYGRPEADWGSYFRLSESDIIYTGKPDVGVAGYDIGWLNDFDGDGIDDYLIAAFGGRNNVEVPGEVYMILGRSAPLTTQFLPDFEEGHALRWMRFTADFWEPNGSDDFTGAEIDLYDPANEPMRFHSRYDLTANTFYLYDLDGTELPETCSPGDAMILSIGPVQLDCRMSTAFITSDRTLRVRWRARWMEMPSQSLDFNVRLRAVDKSGIAPDFKDFGIWILKVTKLYLPMLINKGV